jgi:dienelactone hydrolase
MQKPKSDDTPQVAAERRHFLTQLVGGALAGGWGLSPVSSLTADDGPSKPARLDRTNLLIYHDEAGAIHPVRSQDDWQKRRAIILDAMQQIMGPLPGPSRRVPLELRVERETDDGTYLQRLISYQTDPGSRVPAYLLIPKAALEPGAKSPAVLSPLGTGMSATAFGKQALENDGLPRWGDGRDYARELAERGYVTLVPAYPHLGEYRPDLHALGYQSGTMQAVWTNIRGLDLLDSLPYVPGGRYGSIGHSLGGHNSIYTAVFDQRIAAVVSSCGFDSYLDYYGGDEKVWMPEKGWAQTRYMPKLAEYRGRLEEIPFDFHEILGALAPRACFVNAPLGDSNFQWKSAAAVVKTARQVYRLFETPDRLQIVHPDAGHAFPDDVRLAAYRFLDNVLRKPIKT